MTIHSTKIARGLGALAAVALLAAGPAHAQLGKDEQKCRGTMAKSLGKLVKTVQKEIGKCHKSQNGGKIGPGIDCNDTSDINFPTKSADKIDKAAAKLDGGIQKKCFDKEANEIRDVLSLHISCPAPCTGEVPNPLVGFGDIADCLACLGVNAVEEGAASVYGSPSAGLTKDEQKCHAGLVKGYSKLVDTSLKEQQSCQKGADKDGNNVIDGCEGADPKGKVGKTVAKAEGGLDKSCTDGLLANLGACDIGSVANLKPCAGVTMSDLAQDLFPPSYENRAVDICPEFLTTRILGINSSFTADATCDFGFCDGGPNDGEACNDDVDCPDTATSLSVGFTGLAHGIEIPDNYITSVGIDCPGTYHICENNLCEGGPNDGNACSDDLDCSDCGDCTITGIARSAANNQFQSFTRCESKPWVECENPLGTDPISCGGSSPNCAYFLGGNLAGASGGTPTCSRNRLFTDITGTANLEDGTGLLNIELRSIVHTGLSQAQPCPICVGDTTPQDGIKDGTCEGGANDPDAASPVSDGTCDVHAFDLTYGGTSHDCPPAATANISGTGLVIPLPLSTGSGSLTADIACVPPGAENCFSAQCSLAQTVPCFTNADCGGGEGTCTSQGSGVNTQPNECDGNCVAGGIGVRGKCDAMGGNPAADFAAFCDGFTRVDGKGILTCDPGNGDADCDALAAACPGNDCGSCNLFEAKSCFLDPTNFSGTPDREAPVLVGKFPLPPTNNAGVNAAVGSPGPALVFIDMRTTPSHK